MCGIAGILNCSLEKVWNLNVSLGVMNDLQRHRGPDGEGVWTHPKGHIGFAHQRLSIIDLVTGHQPMTDGEDNWVTFNGEIYNYLELRDVIGLDKFKTASDTEVILHAYQKWGIDCVNHFRGMFAFAARSMVTRYGMVPELGHIAYDRDRQGFLGGPGAMPAERSYSEQTAQAIDGAVRALVDQAFEAARGILARHRGVLEESARLLLEKETLDEAQLRALFARM